MRVHIKGAILLSIAFLLESGRSGANYAENNKGKHDKNKEDDE